ncbi:hypothetical protein IPN35_00405 [Candidatus Peregrinibacteria bacterium]|nr:MAG: hypothetical protein IPN35_00405 [Candidatus Peregrinibacteria bacterium]
MNPLYWRSLAHKRRFFEEKRNIFQWNDKNLGSVATELSPSPEKEQPKTTIDYSDQATLENLPTNHLSEAWENLKLAQEKTTLSLRQNQEKGRDYYFRKQEVQRATPLSSTQSSEHIANINEGGDTYDAQFEIHKALYGETNIQDEMGNALSKRLDTPIVRQQEVEHQQQQKQENSLFRVAIEDPRVRNIPPEQQIPLIKKFLEQRNTKNKEKGDSGYAEMKFDENAAKEVLKNGGTIAFRNGDNKILILGIGPPNGNNPEVQYLLDEHPHDEKNGRKKSSGLNGIQKKETPSGTEKEEYENCQISRNWFTGISSTRYSGRIKKRAPATTSGNLVQAPQSTGQSQEPAHTVQKKLPESKKIPVPEEWTILLSENHELAEAVGRFTKNHTDTKIEKEAYNLLFHLKLNNEVFPRGEEKTEEIFTEDPALIDKALIIVSKMERSQPLHFFKYRRENLEKSLEPSLRKLTTKEDGKPKDKENEHLVSKIQELIWNGRVHFRCDDLRNFIYFQKTGNATFLESVLINHSIDTKSGSTEEISSASTDK